jgi:hypothetical protein
VFGSFSVRRVPIQAVACLTGSHFCKSRAVLLSPGTRRGLGDANAYHIRDCKMP